MGSLQVFFLWTKRNAINHEYDRKHTKDIEV